MFAQQILGKTNVPAFVELLAFITDFGFYVLKHSTTPLHVGLARVALGGINTDKCSHCIVLMMFV